MLKVHLGLRIGEAIGDEGIEISDVDFEVAENLVLEEAAVGELPAVAKAQIWLLTLVLATLQC